MAKSDQILDEFELAKGIEAVVKRAIVTEENSKKKVFDQSKFKSHMKELFIGDKGKLEEALAGANINDQQESELTKYLGELDQLIETQSKQLAGIADTEGVSALKNAPWKEFLFKALVVVTSIAVLTAATLSGAALVGAVVASYALPITVLQGSIIGGVYGAISGAQSSSKISKYIKKAIGVPREEFIDFSKDVEDKTKSLLKNMLNKIPEKEKTNRVDVVLKEKKLKKILHDNLGKERGFLSKLLQKRSSERRKSKSAKRPKGLGR
ncbi:MAG: hypothetical protein K0T99_01620 [Alphaproteobacteria bacterium]|nr:hypothetical protein [Alphaproteobacteria bacterium]